MTRTLQQNWYSKTARLTYVPDSYNISVEVDPVDCTAQHKRSHLLNAQLVGWRCSLSETSVVWPRVDMFDTFTSSVISFQQTKIFSTKQKQQETNNRIKRWQNCIQYGIVMPSRIHPGMHVYTNELHERF